MSNTFIYEQGWLVEKPELIDPGTIINIAHLKETDYYAIRIKEYREHLATLRRFKYDYPAPKKEMELGKDFELKTEDILPPFTTPGILDSLGKTIVAIPITQRTYSEQEMPLKQEGTKLLVVKVDGYLAFNTYVRESEFELMKGRLASVLGRPVPPEYKTFSEQDLLDVWDAAKEFGIDMLYCIQTGAMRENPSKEEFFKNKFGIEIK